MECQHGLTGEPFYWLNFTPLSLCSFCSSFALQSEYPLHESKKTVLLSQTIAFSIELLPVLTIAALTLLIKFSSVPQDMSGDRSPNGASL